MKKVIKYFYKLFNYGNAKTIKIPEILELNRIMFGAAYTLGVITHNGEYVCHTIEDKDRRLENGGKKIYSQTAIPRGTYVVESTYSTRFKKYLPSLLNVPQFSGIRIHAGSYYTNPNDTSGCIIPCYYLDGKTLDSKAAFERINSLIVKLLKTNTLKIVIK